MHYYKTLTKLRALVLSVFKDIQKSKNRGEITRALQALSVDLEQVVDLLKKDRRKVPTVSKTLDILSNSVDGLLNAIQDKSIRAVDFKQQARVVEQFGVAKFFASIDSDSDNIKKLDAATTPAEIFKPAEDESSTVEIDTARLADKFKVVGPTTKIVIPKKLQRPEPISSDDIDMPTRVELNDREAAKDDVRKAERNAKYREQEREEFELLHLKEAAKPKLPRKINGPFALAKYPVVPLLRNEFALDTLVTALKAARFDVHRTGSYLTLGNQDLLVIDSNYLKKMKNKRTPSVYAEHVMTVINAKSSRKMGLMSSMPRAVPEAPHLKLFWIMPLNRMPARMQPANIVKWDLLKTRDVEELEMELERVRNAEQATAEREAARREELRKQRAKAEEDAIRIAAEIQKAQTQRQRSRTR